MAGQIAAVVAVALFVAQAINFGLLLREQQRYRFWQVTAPAVTRLVDASNGLTTPDERRSRVRFTLTNPVPGGLERRPDVEDGIRAGLTEAGVPLGQVVAALREMQPHDERFGRMGPRRTENIRRRGGTEILIAVEQPGKGWLALRSGWPRGERIIIWQLVAQTFVLFVILLLPLVWATRRIARPLRTLAIAARGFRPGEDADPVEERGPADVQAVIAAYNALSLRVTAMLQEKDRMLGAIGHDLRTPLAALRVRIESVEDDADRTKMADTIDEMNRTLEDILSLARLGRPSEARTETDLASLIDAVVDDFRELDHDVAFEDAPRTILTLRPSLMRRAVRNLIENAVKYAGSAEVRLVPEAHHIAIEVADRGPGVPDDKLLAVFDPFTRLETSRNRETGGIGLGLALARAIVQEAGGSVGLANRPGGGLVATIRLPRSLIA